MDNLISDADLRRLAERRVDAKAGFWIHAAIFAAVNAGMALGGPITPWFLWSAGGWGLALVAHGVGVCLPLQDLRRQAVEAELARLKAERRESQMGSF
jgi:hypothetical protein